MRLSLVFIISGWLVLVNAIPHKQHLHNDVNDVKTSHFSVVELPQESSLPHKLQHSTVLYGSDNNNKTVCKSRYRKRRDVAHLDLAYLPAEIPQTSPSSEYLPPVTEGKDTESFSETPQPDTTTATLEAEISTESSHPKNVYLPPSATFLPPLTEVEPPQIPSNEYLPPVQAGEVLSELPLEYFSEKTKFPLGQSSEKSSAEIVDVPIETTQDSAVLDVDGYHYKTPAIKPDLSLSVEPTNEYLPALKDTIVEAEGPENGDSTVLQDDGYHYRSIKVRF